ncbi:GntR family transcriptional regulator [Micromonospora sp. NPDC003241]
MTCPHDKTTPRLAVGKTSARYGKRVPTPSYGLPRYRSIADELQRRIDEGEIQAGSLLPSEAALSAEFRASRGTIRKAIAILRDTGSVTTDHGRGTCLKAPLPERIVNDPLPEVVQARQVSAPPEVARLFGIQPGAFLLEEVTVTQRSGRVEVVSKTYRRPRESTT